jgi:uncharacterized membrane protein
MDHSKVASTAVVPAATGVAAVAVLPTFALYQVTSTAVQLLPVVVVAAIPDVLIMVLAVMPVD